MDKLRFDFTVNLAEDRKSNIICITSIATPSGNTYGLPIEYQPAYLHEVITKTTNYTKIEKTLKERYQTRRIWINLTDDISKTYLDEEQNLQFDNFYLEEVSSDAKFFASNQNQTLNDTLQKYLEEKDQKPETQNLTNLAKDFMIEKFTGRNSNTYQWIKDFNEECERFQIVDDRKKIEMLKNFLEYSAVDWYSCMLLKNTVHSKWDKWEKNFCETFANKGWSSIRYALAFKYHSGSLLDYAIKKERLLLEVRKSIDVGTLIDLIAFGLPNYVADKIDRNHLYETEDLYNELGKLEHLVARSRYEIKNSDDKTKKCEEKQPCKICINNRKGKRYHNEENCWFNGNKKKSVVKTVNNSELEVELNEKNPKN